MAEEYEPNTIYEILSRIDKRKIVLPNIQRPLVWSEDKICKLFDSIMRKYPFGSLIFWDFDDKGKGDVKYRDFIRSYDKNDEPKKAVDKTKEGEEINFVLDGQQRLQALYIGLYGSFNGKYLCLNLKSGDEEELEYLSNLLFDFVFLSNEEIKNKPEYIRVSDMLEIEENENIPHEHKKLINKLGIKEDSKESIRITTFLSRFIDRFRMKKLISCYSVRSAVSLNEVLEIFSRVNMGGTPLTKSDLMFSLVKAEWEEVEDSYYSLIKVLNDGGFEFDTDDIIQASLVINNLGNKFDIKILEKSKNLNLLKESFPKLKSSYLQLKNFLDNESKILSGRFLHSYEPLLPIIYYISFLPHHRIPESEFGKINKFLYISLFNSLFSKLRSAVNKCNEVIFKHLFGKEYSKGDDLGKLELKNYSFPLEEILAFFKNKQLFVGYNQDTLCNNLDLTLNVLKGGIKELPVKRGWRLEYDHIIPKRLLKDHRIPEEQINDLGNFRLLDKISNIVKGKKIPDKDTDFSGNDVEEIKISFDKLIDSLNSDSFDKELYFDFLNKRRKWIVEQVKMVIN